MNVNIGHSVQVRRAARAEIRRQMSEQMENLENDVMALFLFEMHEQYGFGAVKLRNFAERMYPHFHELCEYYGTDNDNEIQGVYYRKLKEIGLDVAETVKTVHLKYTVH